MSYTFIAAAMLCWTITAFIYRVVENYKGNRFSMAMAMGFTAGLSALVYGLISGHDLFGAGGVYFGLGASQGAVQAILIPVFMAAVSRGDLSVTWTILTLSFALAAGLSLVYPGEQLTLLGLVGLLIAGAAIGLLGVDARQRSIGPAHRQPRKGWLFFMALSFVLNAAAVYAFGLPDAVSPGGGIEGKLAFLVAAGAVFGLGGAVLLIANRKLPNIGVGLLGGLVAGLLLFVGSLTTLQALGGDVPRYIVFPSTNGGSGVLVVLLSVVLLKERPGRAGWLGIGVGLAALVLFGMATGGAAAAN